MKYLKTFENMDFYNGYTSSFSDDGDYQLYNKNFSLDELLSYFRKYKDIFEKSYDIDKLKIIIKNELNDLYKKMNVKSFINSLKLQLSISNENSLNYFNMYIDSIPRKYRKIYDHDYSNYKRKKYKDPNKDKFSEKVLKKESNALYEELTKLVLWVKENNKKVLLTFDGRDSGGKGSLVRFILKNFFAAPLGRNIIYKDFGVPTKWEQKNWFHRYKKNLPTDGQVVLFDRSWYNRAVNDPVMGYCTEKQYDKFMTDTLPFEDYLKDNDIIHIKFWLSIQKETQINRFDKRKNSPIKYWKFSENDLIASTKWDDFTVYINKMFKTTSTPDKPWVIVNMDNKPYGYLNTLRYFLTKIPYENKNTDILKIYPEIVYEIKK